MDALEECHKRLGMLLGPGAEPIEVLRCAEKHRAYWRPERVRVVLLAESHVKTTCEELGHRVVLPVPQNNDFPSGFVRLVYCLGYGENDVLDRPLSKNPGTPQFWEIFYSCVNAVRANTGFASILKSRTTLSERIANKIALLQRLKEAGVWLLDASVAALYPKPKSSIVRAAIATSWDLYVGPMVRSAQPDHIICIGRGVRSTLGSRLDFLGVPVTTLAQPQAHLSSAEHLQQFRTYYEVVQQARPNGVTSRSWA
jgi:hypothetical protein